MPTKPGLYKIAKAYDYTGGQDPIEGGKKWIGKTVTVNENYRDEVQLQDYGQADFDDDPATALENTKGVEGYDAVIYRNEDPFGIAVVLEPVRTQVWIVICIYAHFYEAVTEVFNGSKSKEEVIESLRACLLEQGRELQENWLDDFEIQLYHIH